MSGFQCGPYVLDNVGQYLDLWTVKKVSLLVHWLVPQWVGSLNGHSSEGMDSIGHSFLIINLTHKQTKKQQERQTNEDKQNKEASKSKL